jgi:hypothetical protein
LLKGYEYKQTILKKILPGTAMEPGAYLGITKGYR